MPSEYGIKIKNFQAGALYQCNLGVRKNYDYTKAMFTNNLLMYYLLDNGLKVDNGWTRDIVCIEFDYGSRSYEEEIKHLDKRINDTENYTEEQIEFFKSLKIQAENNKDLFDKKSADEIRKIFYNNGVEIRHDIKKKNGKIIKQELVHYKMLYRSTGKAKDGSCMFICDRLYDKALDFIRMSLKLPNDNAPIVEIGAYSSLIASSIVGTIKINPRNILILEDVDSYFETNVISVETDEDKHCIAVPKSNYKLKNTMFDGQGLIDESIFPHWGNGYVLLRHHMCKMACFKTRIQKFFKDYYGDEYYTKKIKDYFGYEHRVCDIQLITTTNAVKWTKFTDMGASYDYWCKKIMENGCLFGVVKTAHESKLGSVQKMSYQMINSLDIDIMDNVIEKSKEYIEKLKSDDNFFIQYLKDNQNFSNDYKVLVALCEQNPLFIRCDYFRNRKRKIIEQYVQNFKFGKVIQNADNLVFVGSPYAMLLHSVGESVENDTTFNVETDAIQCFTTRFDDGEYLAVFRSPHNSANGIGHLHNVYNELFFKYFDFGKQIIAINTNHTDIEDRLNGCDFDSDSGFVTNQKDIARCAKKSYKKYPTIVNNIPKDKNTYTNTLDNFALVDNKLAKAQSAIGLSSNIAQIAQSYMYTFPNEQKYKDYVCILSVLAQCAIDNAKRAFDVDIVSEIDRISKDMDIAKNGYPIFWKHVKDKKTKFGEKKFNINKINKDLVCPMNCVMNVKFKKTKAINKEIPIGEFFNKFELEKNRKQSKKVEELIEKYSLGIFNGIKNQKDDDHDDYLMSLSEFDELLEDIKRVYLSKTYLGLMSWLIDRAFLVSAGTRRNRNTTNCFTSRNKSLLLKILYDINPSNVLKIFSKPIEKYEFSGTLNFSDLSEKL